MNTRMNFFENYPQKGILPIENNISRILARILNDNVFILEDFVSHINEKLKKCGNEGIPKLNTKYEVLFQEKVKNINIDNCNRIIGVGLTTQEYQNQENYSISGDANSDALIPDIVVANYNDVLIVIEVKRTGENCERQLLRQINSIIGEENIEKSIVSMEWSEIVEILERYRTISKIEDIRVNDYYDFLKNHFSKWFYAVSFSNCENDDNLYQKRIEKLIENIQQLSNNKFDQVLPWNLYFKEYTWGRQVTIQMEDEENLKILLWAGDTCSRWGEVVQSSDFNYFIHAKENVEITGISNHAKQSITPYIKIANNYGGGEYWGIIDKSQYLRKSDYEDMFQNLCGRWNKEDGLFKRKRNLNDLVTELEKEKFLNKELFLKDINAITRKQINLSMGFQIKIQIPIEDLKAHDTGFDYKTNRDDLAEPILNFINQLINNVENYENGLI